jgi:hypothetical protein
MNFVQQMIYNDLTNRIIQKDELPKRTGWYMVHPEGWAIWIGRWEWTSKLLFKSFIQRGGLHEAGMILERKVAGEVVPA